MTKFFNTPPYNEPAFGNAFGQAFGNAFGPAGGVVLPDLPHPVVSGNIVQLDSRRGIVLDPVNTTDVRQWTDQTTELNHVLQTTTSKQPFYDTTSDTTPFLDFNGTSDSLVKTAYTGGAILQANTIIFVEQLKTIANGYAFDGITTNQRHALFGNATQHLMFAGTVFTTLLKTLNKSIVVCVFNGSSSKFYLNGGTPVTGSAGSSIVAGLKISGRFSDTEFRNARYYAFDVYNVGLTVANINIVGEYFGARFGIPWTTAT